MEGFKIIIHSLNSEYARWSMDECWAKHASGLTIWIGSGFLNCRVEKPDYQELSILERFKLYRAIKKIQKDKLANEQ